MDTAGLYFAGFQVALSGSIRLAGIHARHIANAIATDQPTLPISGQPAVRVPEGVSEVSSGRGGRHLGRTELARRDLSVGASLELAAPIEAAVDRVAANEDER
jgi:hypothetical protein